MEGLGGQWFGPYSGSNAGKALIDIDDMGAFYEISGYLYDNNNGLPSSSVFFRTSDKRVKFTASVDIRPIDPRSQEPTSRDNVTTIFPGVTFPSTADVVFNCDRDSLKIEWLTDIGTHGAAELPRSRAGELSEYVPSRTIRNWSKFKEFASSIEPDRYVFRGQSSNKWRLRTTFHRTGRANLVRFLGSDIPILWKNLSAITKHVFDFSKPEEHAAFVSLVQHHGYPTPLLDWTHSPFIAAFMAYHTITNKTAMEKTKDRVRIIVLDKKEWSGLRQVGKLSPMWPHMSLLDPISIENARMIPQQALSTVTNMDDVESYIRSTEAAMNKSFLQMIDLPVRDRPSVMRELSLMGITAGSLFPGLDGACEELKERFFRI